MVQAQIERAMGAAGGGAAALDASGGGGENDILAGWDDDSEDDDDYVGRGPDDEVDSLGADSCDDEGEEEEEEEEELDENGNVIVDVGGPRDILPKLPGVGAARLKKLRLALGREWRFTTRAQLLALDGIGK